jgi:hypothetical protein
MSGGRKNLRLLDHQVKTTGNVVGALKVDEQWIDPA